MNFKLLINLILIVSFTLISCSTDTVETEEDISQEIVLSQAEKNMLIQMREEEKLARDVYLYLYDKYEVQIFANISNSEQTHMSKVLTLLLQYDIPDPALSNQGEFSNSSLQDLYNQLIQAGETSLIDALKVGATIEDLDIHDLEEFSELTQNQDILEVFANLTCGSRNHMRGFYSQIINEGGDYSPQYISPEEFDYIINSQHEQCNN